jgi:DNA-binding transcriptional LysR family regulator
VHGRTLGESAVRSKNFFNNFLTRGFSPADDQKSLVRTTIPTTLNEAPMDEISQKKQPDLRTLPDITFRQLEIFRTVCFEKSYANAAIELRTSRANVKRSCEEFEKAMGRRLFEETDRTLHPTAFAQGLLGQIGPLSRGLRHLEDGVRTLHQAGRVLRFAAAGEFFRGGLFTDFLARLKINDAFHPCFMKIDSPRFRNALLNAECDVYFGIGLPPSDRMERVDLGPIPWKISGVGKLPTRPAALGKIPWAIAGTGEAGAAESLLAAFRAAGATGGKVLPDDALDEGITFRPDITATPEAAAASVWPCHRFTAVLRKHHPYSELKSRLCAAALA